eukprot:5037764-Pyramimonas_sp.AAC.1
MQGSIRKRLRLNVDEDGPPADEPCESRRGGIRQRLRDDEGRSVARHPAAVRGGIRQRLGTSAPSVVSYSIEDLTSDKPLNK